MIGLEKVTARIIAEAKDEAEKLIIAAQQKSAEIQNAADEKIAVLMQKNEEEIASEKESLVSRSRSNTDMQNRNIILTAKCNALDETFAAAEEAICAFDANQYKEFIILHTCNAILSSAAATVTVLFNEKDRKTVAEDTLSLLNKLYPDRNFVLSDKSADISGGVILDFGDTDVDCSVKAILNEYRPDLEAQLCQLLFETVKK